MNLPAHGRPNSMLVLVAFAIIYIVWGSTYFFIKLALESFPPYMLAFLRFGFASLMMLGWCLVKGERLFEARSLINAFIIGVLLLFCGNGAVVLGEKVLPSAVVAILWSSQPLSFVVMDSKNWRSNFKNKLTLVGLVLGFLGVLMLFGGQLSSIFTSGTADFHMGGMFLVIGGTIAFSAGSLYAKHHPTTLAPAANITWQMLAASTVFLVYSIFNGEFALVEWRQVTGLSWMAIFYLAIFGSVIAFSAYVWLLSVRPVTQVSTFAYVNPVVAIILGAAFAEEHISLLQFGGLLIILISVLFVNLSKYKGWRFLRYFRPKRRKDIESKSCKIEAECKIC
ncbi:EamA family transporter [Olivibacter sitiensis]|uniref:EamA family transporter n=1 Tax=Olivibacter sitiensis TaxID=376470 RepID=UPI0004230309|nr:EamA family transporter [Olivibacter sitiensis]